MIQFDNIQEVNESFRTLLLADLSETDLVRLENEWLDAGSDMAIREGWTEERLADFIGAVKMTTGPRIQAARAARASKRNRTILFVALGAVGVLVVGGLALAATRSRSPSFALGRITYEPRPE